MNTRNVYRTTPMESATRRDKGTWALWAVGLLLLLLLPLSQARAQFQDHIWYFGNSTAGINFSNTTNQPSALNNKYTPFGAEGCFVATNPTTGQLMFYTSGNTIINRNHVPMQNGNLVFPAPAPIVQPNNGPFNSSVNGAQSVAVIEKPNALATGECGKFLYFINDANEYGASGKPGSIYVGEIDMNANGGLGAVTQQPTRIFTNAFTESMYVVARPDNQGAWIILNSVLTNSIEVYAVSAAGTVNTTPVSSYLIPGENWAVTWGTQNVAQYRQLIGSMAYHQKTGKFVMNQSYGNYYQLYIGDFNNATGVLSGMTIRQNFGAPNIFTAYSTEFSPSGKWLYHSIASNSVSAGAIRVYNMQTNTDIGNINGAGSGWPNVLYNGLKAGPDGKLWVNTNNYGSDPYLANRAVRSTFDIENPVMDGFVSFPLPVNTFSYRFPDFLSLIPPPTALNDQATALTNCSPASTTIASLTNDVNNATGNLYIDQITQQPLHGTAQIVSNQLVYTLTDLAFVGTDTIKYLVRSDVSCYAPGSIASALIPVSQCPLDFGDAPDTYLTSLASGGASHLISTGLHIGALAPDIESSGIPALANAAAQSDDNIGSDDEDGVSVFPTVCTTTTSYTLTVPVTNTGTAGARLIGWIDFNRNGVFDPSEAAAVNTPTSGSYQLVWTGLSGISAGFSYARLRLTSDPAITNSTPSGQASNGEVEDYRLSITTGGGTITPDVTSLTICSGAQIAIQYTTNPVGSQVNWIRMPDSLTGVGNVLDAPTATGTTPVSYTYSAWIANAFGCPSNVVTTGVTVNPKPQITPSLCSQTICSGETGAITFLSNIPGETIHWTRIPTTPAPFSGTGNIGESFTNTGPTSLTYTYTIWAEYAGTVSCATSNTITCTIVVDPCPSCSLTAVAGTPVCDPGNATYSVSVTATDATGLNASSGTVTGTAPEFTVSGILAGVDVILTPIGSCTNVSPITVTAPNCCSIATPIASVTSQPICNQPTGTITVTSPLTGVTYSFDGGLTFQASNVKSGLAAGTNYNIVIKDDITGCLSDAVTLTVNPVGNLRASASSNSPVCSGNLLQLIASQTGGSGPITYSWAGPNGFASTLQNPGIASPTAAAGGSYTVTVTDATCSVTATTTVTIATQPDLAISGSPTLTICSGQSTVLNISGDGGANVVWTNTLGETGTGTTINFGGILNVSGQPQTIAYFVTASAGGCSDSTSAWLTINPAPALQVVPSRAIYCSLEETNIVATASSGTATITWTRSPSTPDPPTPSGNGTGSVTINQPLPAGSYTYTITATENGCSSTPATIPITVNN